MSQKFILFGVVLTTCVLLQKSFPWRQSFRRGIAFWQMVLAHLMLVAVGNSLIKLAQSLGLGTSLFMDQEAPFLNIKNLTGDSQILSLLLSILILDFCLYWQHRALHWFPFFWKFHRVHHTDPAMEASSGIRFHPIEIFFSFYFKLMICWLFGISIESYVWFEMLLMSSAIFNHSNLYLPFWLEKILSKLIVTPRIHFVHHSIESTRMHRNFGFFLAIWDYLFGSSLRLSEEELTTMPLGVKGSQPKNIAELLREPFRKDT